MSLTAKLLSASGADKLYSEDVFSAYTYTGNGASQTITNGIDLAGKGGLVWVKDRTVANGHYLHTVTGGVGDSSSSSAFTGTNIANQSTGFTFNSTNAKINTSGDNYVSWTFRKASKFFDVVTYTGNGVVGRSILHGLGQVPGIVITKKTGEDGPWSVYHRSLAANNDLTLNTTAAAATNSAFGVPNASSFLAGSNTSYANENGKAYVAYLFAHDTSADGLIQCGSFTTDGSGNATVNLGWEPQFLLRKRSASVDNWEIIDNARSWDQTANAKLYPNLSNAEGSFTGFVNSPSATGFIVTNGGGSIPYIYLAIRRPNKPPTTGTQVYNAIARTGTGAAATVTGVGFAPDLAIVGNRSFASIGQGFYDRLRGATTRLETTTQQAESTDSAGLTSFGVDGITFGADASGYVNWSPRAYINHFFKRAPGVFDVVCDTGTASAHTVAHSLGAVPELMIRKCRSGVTDWQVYSAGIANTEKLVLNSTAAKTTDTTAWNSMTPTSSVFTVGTGANVNTNTATYVTYLFATLAGVSKCGSYTGNGGTQTINCGFTTGARFILIKRTDAPGDWYVWSSTTGIIAGNDAHLSLNSTAVEVTTNDSIDPDTTGFIVNQLAATNINVTSATYIYLSFA